MRRSQREAISRIREAGGEIISCRITKHMIVKVRSPSGNVFSATIPNSPSDWRSMKNLEAQLRAHMRA